MSGLVCDARGVILPCPQCGQANRLPYARLADRPRCARCGTTLGPLDAPVDIPDLASFTALTETASLPVLVDFWAEWCGPCKMVAPELVKVAAAGAGRWVVAKLNTEVVPEAAARFQIRAIPTFVLFAHGGEIARQSGAHPAGAIQDFILHHAPAGGRAARTR